MVSPSGASSIHECTCSLGVRPKTDAEKAIDYAPGCILCEFGKFGKTTATGNACVDCETSDNRQTPDFYVMSTVQTGSIGFTECLCPVNFFKPKFDSQECTKCALGKISLVTDLTGPAQCKCDKENGWMAVIGFTCAPCAPGTIVFGASCEPCGAGTYRGANDAMTQCIDCEPGKHQTNTGGVSCNVCSGLVSSDGIDCVSPKLPTISAGISKIVFLHFKANTPVKMISGSATAIDDGILSPTLWENGDYV